MALAKGGQPATQEGEVGVGRPVIEDIGRLGQQEWEEHWRDIRERQREKDKGIEGSRSGRKDSEDVYCLSHSQMTIINRIFH